MNIDDTFNYIEVRADLQPFYLTIIKSKKGTVITFICDTYGCQDGYINIRADRVVASNKCYSELARQSVDLVKLLLGNEYYQIYKF